MHPNHAHSSTLWGDQQPSCDWHSLCWQFLKYEHEPRSKHPFSKPWPDWAHCAEAACTPSRTAIPQTMSHMRNLRVFFTCVSSRVQWL